MSDRLAAIFCNNCGHPTGHLYKFGEQIPSELQVCTNCAGMNLDEHNQTTVLYHCTICDSTDFDLIETMERRITHAHIENEDGEMYYMIPENYGQENLPYHTEYSDEATCSNCGRAVGIEDVEVP